MNEDRENNHATRRIYAAMDDGEIFHRAEQMMRRERRYLDRGLTMEMLAAEMEVHRNSLSRAVDTHAGMNVPSWINRYRVEEAERLWAEAGEDKVKLINLALRAGFRSHSSFYRAFMDMRQSAPSAVFKDARKRGNQLSNKPSKNKIQDL